MKTKDQMPLRFSFRRAAWLCAGALLGLASGVGRAGATTLIVLVSDRAIVIGADSMRTLAVGGTEAVCKIHETGAVVYAFAGAVNSESFDAVSIARSELAAGGELGEKARRIADRLQAGLVQHFKSRPIEGALRELVDGQRGRPVAGFIAAVVDGKPRGFLVQVLATPSSAAVTLTTRVEPLDMLGADRAIFLSSQHQEVIERANRTMSGRTRASAGELAAVAGELVNLDLSLEAARSPSLRKSGPPTTVAILDRHGFRLVAPGVCGPPPR